MKILTGFSSCSNLFKFLSICLVTALFINSAKAQTTDQSLDSYSTGSQNLDYQFSYRPDTVASDTTSLNPDNFPNPKSVLYKSLMIPGWGQIVNKQVWKVPIVYGLLGGLGWYSVYLTKQYHDYRAAYYNVTSEADDFRFGPTPDYIPQTASAEALRSARNQLRNRRDFVYIAIFLAYGLNAVDAYVFAHMRTFDVSENLSVRTDIKPTIFAQQSAPGVTFSFELFNRSKKR